MQSNQPIYSYATLRSTRDYTPLVAVFLASVAIGVALVLFFRPDKSDCRCHPNHGHHGAVIGEKVQ